jgi:hemerythrin-like domain-containing protein
MTFEHGQERAFVEDMEKDLRLAKLSDFTARAHHLSSTLRNHIYKEDHILFEAVDAILTAGEDDTLFEQLNRFETTFDREALEDKLKDLHKLEWKYLQK